MYTDSSSPCPSRRSILDSIARPAPTQRRSIERVQALLQAFEELLTEQGYESATLKAIGDRAGLPTASVYHYFADRSQIDAELLRTHLDGMERRIDTALARCEFHSLRGAVEAVVEAMLGYYRQHPSLVELWFAARTSLLYDLARACNTSLAHRLHELLLDRHLLRADTSPLVLRTALEAADRLFDVAFRSSRTGDDAVVQEMSRLVTAYLETYAPAPA